MTISQLKDHCIKAHGKTLTLPKHRTMVPSSPRAKQSSRIGKEGPEGKWAILGIIIVFAIDTKTFQILFSLNKFCNSGHTPTY